ncbi:MAG: UDP-N-acetylmuramoylalanyl-D-glutamyl-2,6-diaminopimelate--D-alanyl-D-alanine ligase [Hyphomicrobium sp.]|uniref:UDP-N-acetylmuramoylalanyl-D-glutamyl-2, 6-diaminopimelate--D-alanyl-D-alanine ligase n=1 Tax=Hyphomicrobium sp. TaxID=82 RepID=UPI001324B69D|nr:UDP-N-acetylmuramoylalanyl-D-glutamyl-2,6-diaminopimelate--D-alanyl-D-alanine ligase [Hyphomicrobium sp.]KAB2937884.1 MAG: UDP-N-acetylmuramoylalanyl-D-glutamyl-2,6-diaminopimelate--D-alanyl-D-alanine ligase [Hyphomicrobium sp.]MBZ0210680.1 UDP-N-acetylmuramoylalanyl-D-glutamyl-2,6-diaminopimelate--D-alanyl-D-alanine ligase [Hyphomicrobium sp.]
MTGALWTWDNLVPAAIGAADGAPVVPITGFSIDTRSLQPGEVFVALRDVRDGHDFVLEAFRKGAAAALVSAEYERKAGDGALLRVRDTLEGLRNIAAAARRRSQARIVAVTGSVGKTGTKEALRNCLSRLAATHAAEKSFNNHWGVPLTLARMPADVRYGVFEIGMNHAGEITPLTALVRPHVAIVTTVEPVHLEFFGTVEKIAEAKAEIFAGLEPGGVAVLNRDNAQFDLLARAAGVHGARIISFGRHENADVRPEVFALNADGSDIAVRIGGRRIAYRVGAPGAHLAQNSLAVVAALDALGADVEKAVPALAEMRAAKGRGARREIGLSGGSALLIDESYNANPASMRSALAAMATVPRTRFSRRIAVLGDMLELGAQSGDLHAALNEPVDAAQVDLVFACGPNMRRLFEALPAARRGAWAPTSEGIAGALAETVRAGDVVMIKGSLGSHMAPLIDALIAKGERECARV